MCVSNWNCVSVFASCLNLIASPSQSLKLLNICTDAVLLFILRFISCDKILLLSWNSIDFQRVAEDALKFPYRNVHLYYFSAISTTRWNKYWFFSPAFSIRMYKSTRSLLLCAHFFAFVLLLFTWISVLFVCQAKRKFIILLKKMNKAHFVSKIK